MENFAIAFQEQLEMFDEIGKTNFLSKVSAILNGYEDQFPELANAISELNNSGNVDTVAQVISNLTTLFSQNVDKYIDNGANPEVILELSQHFNEVQAILKELNEIELPTKVEGLSVAEAVRQVSILTAKLGSNDALAVVPNQAIEEIMYKGADIDQSIRTNVEVTGYSPDTLKPYIVTYGEKEKMEEELLKQEQERRERELAQQNEQNEEFNRRINDSFKLS